MDRVRVRNLRSLADTGEIELKPITLLVGANNSGKSSFLRFFPLLRQSTETRTGSGLLLNEPYVDYGLFPVAVRQGAEPPEITFDLGTRPALHHPDRALAIPVLFPFPGLCGQAPRRPDYRSHPDGSGRAERSRFQPDPHLQHRPERRSRLNMVYMFCYFIGGALGSYLGAWCWHVAGWWGVCGFGTTALVIAIAAEFTYGRRVDEVGKE
jgi:hypothetical protein